MIQQEMIFALGFLTAGLLAMACLPAVWRRAIRLTTQRLSRLVPLSMDEIVAERDGLRAGFAVERRQLEQKMDAIEARRAELMIRLGQRDVAVATLEDAAEVAAARIAALVAELSDTTRELHGVRAETGAAAVALHDLTGLAERRRWEVIAAGEKVRSLDTVIDQNRATIASLETRILGLDDRIVDLDRALDNARAELARTVQAVARAGAERDAAIEAERALETERDRLAKETARLTALVDERDRRIMALMGQNAVHRTTIEDLQVQIEAQFSMQREAAGAAAARIEALDAEKSALARRLSETQDAPSQDEELATLRKALIQVADDVLRMTERDARSRSDDPETAVL